MVALGHAGTTRAYSVQLGFEMFDLRRLFLDGLTQCPDVRRRLASRDGLVVSRRDSFTFLAHVSNVLFGMLSPGHRAEPFGRGSVPGKHFGFERFRVPIGRQGSLMLNTRCASVRSARGSITNGDGLMSNGAEAPSLRRLPPESSSGCHVATVLATTSPVGMHLTTPASRYARAAPTLARFSIVIFPVKQTASTFRIDTHPRNDQGRAPW